MAHMRLVRSLRLPREQGVAFDIKQGQILRIIEVEGPQVVDFEAFVLANPRERLCAGRTRAKVGVHPQSGDTLWSVSPHERPMFTIVADTVRHQLSPDGAVGHDLLYACCSKSVYEPYGLPDHPNCHDNIARAILPYGLSPEDVHTPFNLFMKTGIRPDGTMFFEAPDSVAGDYVDLRAETDCLVALSACPSGDLQVTNAGSNKPVLIEIYEASQPG
jgi:uncharacterized protein YcgI (DUF1989 family)